MRLFEPARFQTPSFFKLHHYRSFWEDYLARSRRGLVDRLAHEGCPGVHSPSSSKRGPNALLQSAGFGL
jgi:hypothetical protein